MDVFVGILDLMFSFQVSEFVGFCLLNSKEIPKSWFSGKILSFFGWFFEGWWFRMIPTHAVVLEKTFG